MNLPTIHELRKQGYKVRINHYRYVASRNPSIPSTKLIATHVAPTVPTLERLTKEDKRNRKYGYVDAKGGLTEVEITAPNGGTTEVRAAQCNRKDAFNRRLGIRICLGRLRKDGVI